MLSYSVPYSTLKEYSVTVSKDELGFTKESLQLRATHYAWVESFGSERAQETYGFKVSSTLRAITVTEIKDDSIVEFKGKQYRVSRVVPYYKGEAVHHYEVLLSER